MNIRQTRTVRTRTIPAARAGRPRRSAAAASVRTLATSLGRMIGRRSVSWQAILSSSSSWFDRLIAAARNRAHAEVEGCPFAVSYRETATVIEAAHRARAAGLLALVIGSLGASWLSAQCRLFDGASLTGRADGGPHLLRSMHNGGVVLRGRRLQPVRRRNLLPERWSSDAAAASACLPAKRP